VLDPGMSSNFLLAAMVLECATRSALDVFSVAKTLASHDLVCQFVHDACGPCKVVHQQDMCFGISVEQRHLLGSRGRLSNCC
jgi:hypothetical protein